MTKKISLITWATLFLYLILGIFTYLSITNFQSARELFESTAFFMQFNLVWFDSLNYPEVYDDPNVEIVRITAISGDILTVTRAQESTLATTKSTGGGEYRMILSPTKKTIDDIRLDIADLMPVNYEIRIQEDSGDSDISYVGKAVPGSLTASAIWQVARVDENTGTIQEWADGNDSFDNVWDNREKCVS